ncbi:MAG: MFS transporter [Actinomycetota bacterium]|nr:MFS transporter [Actinomycetota bacterium]
MSSTVPQDATATAGGGRAFPWLPPAWLLVVGLVAVAANLRVGLAGVPPLVGLISSDLGLSNAAVGVLTTLPVLCMGAFAPVAHWASTRWGSAPVVLVATVLAAMGSALRLMGSSLPVLYAATLVLGVGIAVAGTLLPRLVKTMFPPERVGLVTGVYMVALMGGATASAALSAPLARLLGSWEGSLASWSVIGLVAVVVWYPLSRAVWRHRAEVIARSVGSRLPWRSRTAWLVSAYLAVQSWVFYSTLAWLAPSFIGLGWDVEHAGYLLSVFSAAQILAGLVVPAVTDRVHDLRTLLVPVGLVGAAGLVGLVLAPDSAPWLWAVLAGLGQGSSFALALVLLVRAAATPHASGGLSAMGFLVGYGVASLGPLAMGAIRDATGGFHGVWFSLVVFMVAQLAVALTLRPGMALVGES